MTHITVFFAPKFQPFKDSISRRQHETQRRVRQHEPHYSTGQSCIIDQKSANTAIVYCGRRVESMEELPTGRYPRESDGNPNQ